MDDIETPVTPDEANPDDEDNQPDESNDGQSPPDPPVSPPTSDGPDPAYKGLQRVLEREKAKTRELEAKLQQAQNQPVNAVNDAIVQTLIGEIAQQDPERGNLLAQQYRNWAVQTENQRLRTQQVEAEQNRMISEAEQRNVEELRAIASDLGADPDSPMIDYGDSNEWLAERITKVRASARAAAAPVTPVRAPKRTIEEQHNTQTGAPPQTARANTATGEVTEAMLAAAQAKYARAFAQGGEARKTAEAELSALNERFAAQLFA